jgi:hypothetical protein
MKFQKKNIALTIGFIILVALFLNHYSFTFECIRWLDPITNQNTNSKLLMQEHWKLDNGISLNSKLPPLIDGECNQRSAIPSGLLWKRNKQNELLTADFFIVAVGALALAFVMTHKKKE